MTLSHPPHDSSRRDETLIKVHHNHGRRVALIGSAVLFAAAVLLVIANIDRSIPNDPDPIDPDRFEPLIDGGFTQDEIARAGDDAGGTLPDLEQGMWTQWADEEGKLAKRFKADKLDPLPDSKLAAEGVEAQVFLKSGRIVALESDRALVTRGERGGLESIDMTGNVVIRIFEEGADGTPIDVPRDAPSVLITAAQAEFDDLRGKIRCDERVDITTPTSKFHGVGLTILFDKVTGLQRVVVDRCPDPIWIAQSAFQPAPVEGADEVVVGDEEPVGEKVAEETDEVRAEAPPADQPRARDRTTPPSKPQPVQFFRTTFHENVVIHRIVDGRRQSVRGYEMLLTFSMDNTGLGESLSSILEIGPARARRSHWRPFLNMPEVVSTLAIAGLGQDRDDIAPLPQDGDIYISFTGRMVMEPANDPQDRLPSADDIRLEVRGNPVVLYDEINGATAECAVIAYESTDQVIRMIGSESQPLVMADARMRATGQIFEWSTTAHLARFIGAGTLTLHAEQDDADPADPAPAPPDSPVPPEQPLPTESLDIRWSRGVELHFAEDDPESESNGSRMREAIFRGDVVVRNVAADEQFNLQTQELAIVFADDAGVEQADSIESIEATGEVLVQGLDAENSQLTGGHLRLDFEWNEELQKRSPRLLVVDGEIEVRNAQQILMADKVTAVLRELADVSPDADGGAAAGGSNSPNVEIETLLAEGRVRILFDRGIRATGDRLEADSDSGQATLTGLPVRITGDKDGQNFIVVTTHTRIEQFNDGFAVVIDEAGQLRMKQSAGASVRRDPPSEDAEQLPRADDVLDEDPSGEVLQVTWDESFRYDEMGGKDRAKIDIRGGVKGLSFPNALERTTIDGEMLILDLIRVPDAPLPEGGDDPAQNEEPPQDNPFGVGGNLELVAVHAFGAPAKIESHEWAEPGYVGPAQKVNYIQAKQIDFDLETGEAAALGGGMMLVKDLTPPGPDEEPPQFGEGGTTLFEWTGHMRRMPLAEGRYEVTMNGDVAMRHLDLENAPSTLSAATLTVQTENRDADEQLGGLDFGGSTTLVRLKASETGQGGARRRVHLEGQGKIFNCTELDYDYDTGIAKVFGTKSRPAWVQMGDRPGAIKATGFLWHSRDGRVEVKDVRSSIPD